MNAHRSRASFLFVGLLAASACGDIVLGSNIQPLERSDVEDLPPGDARGESADGAYSFVGFSPVHCSCRQGDELDFGCEDAGGAGITLEAQALWIDQTDGELEVTPITDAELRTDAKYRGGLDGDGSFVIGSVTPVRDGSGQTIGQAFELAQGVLEPGMRLEATFTSRVQAVIASKQFDCDVIIDVRAEYWDPADSTSCDFPEDCHPSTPYCVAGTCSSGDAGASCEIDDDCGAEQPYCVQGSCHDGSSGAPCDFNSDCSSSTPICLSNVCSPLGDVGDPCVFNTDCEPGLWCGFDKTCEPQ